MESILLLKHHLLSHVKKIVASFFISFFLNTLFLILVPVTWSFKSPICRTCYLVLTNPDLLRLLKLRTFVQLVNWRNLLMNIMLKLHACKAMLEVWWLMFDEFAICLGIFHPTIKLRRLRNRTWIWNVGVLGKTLAVRLFDPKRQRVFL